MVLERLTSAEDWDHRYSRHSSAAGGWRPADYDSRVLERILLKGLRKCGTVPRRILEVGCGASPWLPYLATRTGATVTGIDFSEPGCRLARRALNTAGISGTIHQADLFTADPTAIGTHDFVYSLGVVEHFSDLEAVLSAMLRFVAPEGVLLAGIPNFRSVHGLLGRLWQPRVMAQHKVFSCRRLMAAFGRTGLQDIEGAYAGLFSLNVVAWGIEPRWPRLEAAALPVITVLVHHTDRILCRIGGLERSVAFFSPFAYVSGKRSGKRVDV